MRVRVRDFTQASRETWETGTGPNGTTGGVRAGLSEVASQTRDWWSQTLKQFYVNLVRGRCGRWTRGGPLTTEVPK